MNEEDKITTTGSDEEILIDVPLNKKNRFDSEFKFNEEEDTSGEEVEAEDPFEQDDNEGYQALASEDESISGEIN